MLLATVFVHTSAFAVLGGLAVGIVISWLIAFSKPKPNLFPSSGEMVAGIIFIIVVIVLNPVMGRSWGPQVGLGDLARGNVTIQERIPYLLAFTHQFVTWPLWPFTILYVIGFISLLLRFKRKSLIFGDEIALSLFILILCTWFVTSIFAKFHEDRYLFSILPIFLVLALRELYLLITTILTSVKLSFLRPTSFAVSIILSVFIVILFAPGIIQLVDDDPYGFVPAYLYVQNNWRVGDVVATCSPAPSQLVLGHTDYYVI